MLSACNTVRVKRRCRKPHFQFVPVTKLAALKKTAFRRGFWFKSLNRVERGIIDLTVRYVDKIRSIRLAKLVTAIVNKLQMAMESLADKLVRIIGLGLTQKISSIAVKLGNLSASAWAEDEAFARYLVFCVAASWSVI